MPGMLDDVTSQLQIDTLDLRIQAEVVLDSTQQPFTNLILKVYATRPSVTDVTARSDAGQCFVSDIQLRTRRVGSAR